MTRSLLVVILLLYGLVSRPAAAQDALALQPCRLPEIPEPVRCGTLRVPENRDTGRGRMLALRVVVLPARRAPALPDPVFSLYGGPGQTATEFAQNEWDSWYRDEREIVLLDQRGTGAGGPQPLDCRLAGSDDDPQSYLAPMFQATLVRDCRLQLERVADLTQYSTAIAMEDLEDLRRALGADRINLVGGSYGARAALVYIARHPERVRATVLTALMPYSLRNPLFHARSAQEALDGLLAACDSQPSCRQAFPRLGADLKAVMARLAREAVDVPTEHPESGNPVTLRIGAREFAEALRVMTYTPDNARVVPLAIHRAAEGDLRPFAGAGLASNYYLRRMLRYGMLLSVTCSEDVARITEADIERETRGTLLGADRVRQQIAACAEWPRAALPADHGVPRATQVPALLISGRLDPATPPRFGEEVARDYLPNSLHVVLEQAGHSPDTPCAESIARTFLRQASVAGIDTSCLAQERLAQFVTRVVAPEGEGGGTR